MESTRRERVGWYFYGWADHAFYTTVTAVVIAPYLTGIAKVAAGCTASSDDKCAGGYLHPLGLKIAAGSFYPYLVTLAVILSVVTLPVVGAIADRSTHKRKLLGVFAGIGVLATFGFYFVTGDRYLLGGALFILATMGLSAGAVVYNSFLPQLAAPERRDMVSSIGWSLGYIGGGLHLALCLAAFTVFGISGTSTRWVMVSAGVWWGLFTVVSLVRLRDRPPIEFAELGGNRLTAGFKQLGHTLRDLRKYPLTLFFLGAYLIYNDGIQTVISQASLYATEELGLQTGTLATTILVIQFVAFGGALSLGQLAKRIGAWKTVLLSLILWIGVVLTAFWLPAHNPVAFMLLGAALGLVLGGSQALSRSLFSQLIPRGKEGEYFGFYALADKGMSWLGPLVFGLTYQSTHNYRSGIVMLLIFFVVGFFALLAVPMRRAIVASGNVPPQVL
ncbi:MFS transporter [Longispora fulva]|uniref:UMF1 family MFS transporter n=1 Tax=Longispora fulva TaxID=619741 RepID=A0A8J7KGY9_9ACTN|nr:MFS transporter [Longispora fulva]MBG6135379.1 UMF1 family MFS transporter [Longispora fulva]GIG56378.1 MFS transporter [Longispora fulva]